MAGKWNIVIGPYKESNGNMAIWITKSPNKTKGDELIEALEEKNRRIKGNLDRLFFSAYGATSFTTLDLKFNTVNKNLVRSEILQISQDKNLDINNNDITLR